MRLPSVLAVPSLLLVIVLTGCHVSTHKNGSNDNVDIGTPFGSMHVKTDSDAAISGLGITPYPGAHVEKKDKDEGAADVNMSFGKFHLGVKAVNYTTSDSPEMVIAFYKKDLAKYGDVLQCDGKKTVGDPARTAEGLSCDFENVKTAHLSWNTDLDSSMELRTGSKQHQHIVAVQKKGGETKIGLVALDLPNSVSSEDHKDSE